MHDEPAKDRCRSSADPPRAVTSLDSTVSRKGPAAPVELDDPTSSWSLRTITDVIARCCPDQRGDGRPARELVVESTGREQRTVGAEDGGALDVVEAEFPPRRRRAEVASGSDPVGELAGRRCADPPDGGEVLLGVEQEATAVDLAVEMDGQLRHAGDGFGDVDEDRCAAGIDEPTGDAEVAIEPAVVEDAAVHLDGELLPAEAARIGPGLHPQAG